MDWRGGGVCLWIDRMKKTILGMRWLSTLRSRSGSITPSSQLLFLGQQPNRLVKVSLSGGGGRISYPVGGGTCPLLLLGTFVHKNCVVLWNSEVRVSRAGRAGKHRRLHLLHPGAELAGHLEYLQLWRCGTVCRFPSINLVEKLFFSLEGGPAPNKRPQLLNLALGCLSKPVEGLRRESHLQRVPAEEGTPAARGLGSRRAARVNTDNEGDQGT